MKSGFYSTKELANALAEEGLTGLEVKLLLDEAKYTDANPMITIKREKFRIFRNGYAGDDNCTFHVM